MNNLKLIFLLLLTGLFFFRCSSSKDAPQISAPVDFSSGKYPKKGCVDLTFDTVRVQKITEKYIDLEFTIRNKGTIPAPIFGPTRSIKDNVAIHFFFSGTQRLTRGSILADGIYLTEDLRNTHGLLNPQTTLVVRHRLSLAKKNQFTGVIILQLDAFDIISNECDETNNVKAIVPRWY